MKGWRTAGENYSLQPVFSYRLFNPLRFRLKTHVLVDLSISHRRVLAYGLNHHLSSSDI